MGIRLTRSVPWRRVVVGVLSLVWGLVLYGLIDLLAFAQGPEFHDSILLSTGWGLLVLFLVAGPLLALAVLSETASASAAGVLLAVAASLAVAAVVSGSPAYLLAALAVVVTWLATGSRAGHGWRASWHASAGPAALLLLAAGPFLSYAWTAARRTGTGVTTDDTLGLDHWPAQAALPLAVLLVGAVAAGHPTGWRLPTWLVAATGAWFGVVCLVEPRLIGSVSRPWGTALVIWSLAFLAGTLATGTSLRHEP